MREDLEIYDRVGGGDSFASGLIYGFLAGKGPQFAVECGAAHGALAMTTPATPAWPPLDEVAQGHEGRRRARVALSRKDERMDKSTRSWPASARAA